MNSLNEYNKSILLQTASGLFIATDNGWIVNRCKSADSEQWTYTLIPFWMQMSAIETAFKYFNYKETANVFWSSLIISPFVLLILYLPFKRPAYIRFNQTV